MQHFFIIINDPHCQTEGNHGNENQTQESKLNTESLRVKSPGINWL